MKKALILVVALLLMMMMFACAPSVASSVTSSVDQACSHTYNNVTCGRPVCTKCGAVSETMRGHDFSDATCDEPATCKSCGATIGMALGHIFSRATCDEPATCQRCDKKDGVAGDHSYSKATCQAPKTCSVCGKTEGSKVDHDYKLGNNGADQCSICGNQGYYSYSILALKYHIENLKNPDSIKVYSIYAGYYNRSYNENESGDYIAVVIDSSGTNSYGGVVRSDYICLFDYKNNKVIYDLEGLGEYYTEKYYGNAALQGYDLMIEAQMLSENKTALQKQDHAFVLQKAKQMIGME